MSTGTPKDHDVLGGTRPFPAPTGGNLREMSLEQRRVEVERRAVAIEADHPHLAVPGPPTVYSGPHPIPDDHGLIMDLAQRFNAHPPKADEVGERMQRVRRMLNDAAFVVCGAAPNCRERSLAITKLEESMMWANAAIARNQ